SGGHNEAARLQPSNPERHRRIRRTLRITLLRAPTMARSVALCALAAAVLAACTEPVVPRAAPLTADAPALGKSGTGINFTIRDLGTLGGQSSESYDVNNAKQVVGWR